MLVFSMVTSAQSDNASLSGVAKDPSGALVPGAKIVLTDERTSLERRATTNESGYYIFTNIPPGFYSISVEAAGFKTTQQTHNRIAPSMAANIDLALTVGAIAETVSVTASAGSVLPDSGTIGSVVEREQIENTPLSGRNALYMALLVPGVSGDPLNTLNFNTGGQAEPPLTERRRGLQASTMTALTRFAPVAAAQRRAGWTWMPFRKSRF